MGRGGSKGPSGGAASSVSKRNTDMVCGGIQNVLHSVCCLLCAFLISLSAGEGDTDYVSVGYWLLTVEDWR